MSTFPGKERLRFHLRDAVVTALSRISRLPASSRWIRFPFYHRVFDDERRGFTAHLRWMHNLGDFLCLDDAIDILEEGRPPDGRYFCLTFDDGFRNCLTNALPILLEHKAPAAFFIPTQWIGASPDVDPLLVRRFYDHGRIAMEFLSWNDCKELASAGMTIGSHTVHHARLIDLSEQEAIEELQASQTAIAKALGAPCTHFSAPFGRPGIDFHPERDPRIARALGYRSFLTGRRGSHRRLSAPMMVERDLAVAMWSCRQLHRFLSR